MFKTSPIAGILAAVSLLASASAAAAQEESTNRVSADTDWSVFVDQDPESGEQLCWVVSRPTEQLNTRDGQEVDVVRGDILMFVSFWPEQDRMGEVSYTGGYPYPDGHLVTVEVGSDTFEFATENRSVDGDSIGFAWAAPEDDARLIEAMKRGVDAVVTGISTRGTTTRDTVSLLGFTAAIEDAEARCGS